MLKESFGIIGIDFFSHFHLYFSRPYIYFTIKSDLLQYFASEDMSVVSKHFLPPCYIFPMLTITRFVQCPFPATDDAKWQFSFVTLFTLSAPFIIYASLVSVLFLFRLDVP